MKIKIMSFIILSILTSTVIAKEIITGTYSNLYLNDTSGDLVGMEARIIWSYKGYYISIQCSGDPPFIVPLVKNNNKHSFTIPEENDNFCPSGKIILEKIDNYLHLKHVEIKEFTAKLPIKPGGYWDNENSL